MQAKAKYLIMLQADLFLNLYFKATQILDPWKAVCLLTPGLIGQRGICKNNPAKH